MSGRRIQVTIYCCPACLSELEDEAFSFWCAACRRSWSFTEIAAFDEWIDADD